MTDLQGSQGSAERLPAGQPRDPVKRKRADGEHQGRLKWLRATLGAQQGSQARSHRAALVHLMRCNPHLVRPACHSMLPCGRHLQLLHNTCAKRPDSTLQGAVTQRPAGNACRACDRLSMLTLHQLLVQTPCLSAGEAVKAPRAVTDIVYQAPYTILNPAGPCMRTYTVPSILS